LDRVRWWFYRSHNFVLINGKSWISNRTSKCKSFTYLLSIFHDTEN